MYRSKRSFSRSSNRQNNNFRSRNNFGKQRGQRGQATFDPTHVILQSKSLPVEKVEKEVYQPKQTFADFAIDERLKQNIAQHGFTDPTPIQDEIIPSILENRDVVGIANTGTGKTAAFLIPLIDKILKDRNQKILIIAPTRELAIQVREEFRIFSQNMKIFSSLLIGGTPMGRQIDSLRRGQDVVIGTPGRIKDLYQRRELNFEGFNNIVLDEVDRMLDMGFVHDVRFITSLLPKNRQSLFFSATMTSRVQEIMRGFLTDPVQVSTKTQETSLNVQQDIVKINGRQKVDLLHDMLTNQEFEKVLVFGRTKRGTEQLKRSLVQKGLRVDAIHGNKTQGQRQRALENFRNNRVQALIATDVVARGLDITDVTHVINYDLPESYETYVHRIGRTGRANRTGVALTFVE